MNTKDKMKKVWQIVEGSYLGKDCKSIRDSFAQHMEFTQAKTRYTATELDCYKCLAYTVKDRMMEHWNDTQKAYYDEDCKRVYYLSLEYLMGRALGNGLINLGMIDEASDAMKEMGHDLSFLEEFELDAGLGNGGLGRLASCFLDSMASKQYPGTGYGIRYDFGIFEQKFQDKEQVEVPDHWLKYGNAWEVHRPEYTFTVEFYGKVNSKRNDEGILDFFWEDTHKINAVAYDFPIPGYKNDTVNNLRLWKAEASDKFDLGEFNKGDYISAVEKKIFDENISKVLYPRDDSYVGKELRLKQEYFFVSASLQDIIRRHKVKHKTLVNFHEKVAIQLNDTHPAIAVPELMRILIDMEKMEWDEAFDICVNTFAYTNHTILPEALEKWSVKLLGNLLPRHLDIIYEINFRFLNRVKEKFNDDISMLNRMSIFEEGGNKNIRMAHLAIVGSHSINGVAEIHSKIIREELFKDFYNLLPERFNNKTNGVTPRRWLRLANRKLSDLISSKIGDGWVKDLKELKKLEPFALDKNFVNSWQEVKIENKIRFASFVKETKGIDIDVNSIFDCQIKRIHEYKRQLLNVFHIITLCNRMKEGEELDVPRTFIFSGKAAPGYKTAKDIVKLINYLADYINNNSLLSSQIKIVFLENYNVSLAEKIITAADLSEQISTAGMEASGTGNMKLALNGALTIGTLDGANVEIKEEVRDENIFIFGLKVHEVKDLRSKNSIVKYDELDEELKGVLNSILSGEISNGDENTFKSLIHSIYDGHDYFMIFKDYKSYITCQDKVSKSYLDKFSWAQKSILNTARSGKFSSDRTIDQYAKEIWNIKAIASKDKKTRKER